ncbi:MAG: tetratricopeptide repeat protein [Candidatus Omnitrophica bacterium]|nr:tetratricopeptide repeat protein [Candidatus Omnitrophota bacterium]
MTKRIPAYKKQQVSRVLTNVLKMITVFSIVLLVLVVPGCSEQYKMERMVWDAERAAEPIVTNQGMASTFEFDNAVSKFEKIIEKSPDSQYAINARLRIADLYTVRKLFDKARAVYDMLISSNGKKPELAALCVFKKGQAYELEGNWAQALKTFNEILADYNKTSQSLSVPLYIARYYVKNDEKRSSQQAYAAAINFYQKIADEYKNTKAALLAENLVVRTYMEQEDWNSAITFINKLDKKYKLGPDTLMVLAKIYQNKLDNAELAKATYERILKDFSDKEQIVKAVNQQLESLNKKAD